MADLYLKDPKTGEVVVFDDADAQAAANAGYQPVDQATYAEARASEARQAGPSAAAAQGLVTAPEGYDQTAAFAEKVYSGLTFGQGDAINSPEAIARGRRYQAEHPVAAGAAEMLGQAPYTIGAGLAGSAARTALGAGGSLLGRAAGVAADYGVNAVVGGAQIEGEESRLAAEDFSFTDAALAGVTAEVMGRGAAWTISKTVGGARNLIARAARDTVAEDAERSLTKGGWVGDYRVAQHAEAYRDQLADLGARDLDTLETSFAEVSRQDKKRARIERSVVENPAAQHEINVQAVEGLQRLRTALEGELAEAPGGPAKRLAKQLDDRLAALEEAPKGRKLWRLLDENRQALQEYRQDLHQAYDTNPGSAWLSREGLAAIDAAEEATRTALLREDAWGEAAARMQREYNVPFHEKWFPARQTVLKDLHFATGKDAQGFTTFRGEPSKMRKFLAGLGGTSPDAHRARELFAQYLDGAEAIARAGERDAPRAAREALESVRRLRKNLAQSTFINAATERTASRALVGDVAVTVAAGVGGAIVGGPLGGAAGVAGVRAARLGHWFGQAAQRLGLLKGEAVDLAELLAKDALPAARDAGEGLANRLVDDVLDGPFGVAPSARPPGPGGPIAPEPMRGVGVDLPRPPSTHPGVGQARRAAADRPAGMEAIQPGPRPVDVGPEAPPPRRGGGGFQRLERPESLRASEAIPDRETPSIREGSEVPTPEEMVLPDAERLAIGERETFPAPFKTEGAADLEAHLAPGQAARSAEAARLQALTEGEFAHVVDGLNATGAKAPDGTPLGEFLARHADDLKTAGLIVAGTGAGYAAQDDSSEFQGAAVGGLAGAALSKRLGKALFLGARFEATAAGKAEAKSIVREAIEKLPPPPPRATEHTYGHLVGQNSPTSDKIPGLRKMFEVTREASKGLDSKEQAAISEWVASSHGIKHEQRTGLTDGYSAPYAQAFESAMEKLTVVDPTKHGDLYRFMDLEDSGLADLLTKDEFKAGAHLSTGYYPDTDFGPHELRFTKVDAAGALIGVNPAEMEMVIPPDARFRVTGRYADPETGNFTFVLQEIPETKASLPDVGYLAIPAAGAAALDAATSSGDDTSAQPAGASMGFVGAAALFKTARGKLVADVARRLFSPVVGRAVARLTAKQYTRAELAARRQEFQAWQENPQELVNRVAEGFREVPPEHQATVNLGVFKAATFLKERLPAITKANAISMRDIPVSTEQITKFARFEQATLRPREAWSEAAGRGHISPELLETTEELYPDLLAELRVAAYLGVREEGAPVTVQAKLQYARLFGDDGSFADPSMSKTVAAMSALAYEQQVPTKSGGGPTSSGNVSHVAQANARPAGMAKLG